MSFSKITALVPAGEHFDSSAVGEGVWITTNHLNSIEQSLAGNESAVAAIQDQLTAANASAEASAEEISNLQTAAGTSATTINTQAGRIAELEGEVTRLGGQASGIGSTINSAGDDQAETTPVPSYLDDNNPINQYADKRVKRTAATT